MLILYFLKSSGRSLCCVAFGHIVTVWLVDVDTSLSFLTDLIHCDHNDRVKEVRGMRTGGTNLVVAVHGRCVNVWRLIEAETTSTVDAMSLSGECVWSRSGIDVLLTQPTLASLDSVATSVQISSADSSANVMLHLLTATDPTTIQMLRMTVKVTKVKRSLRGRDLSDSTGQVSVDVKLIDTRKPHRLTSPACGRLNLICVPGQAHADEPDVFYCDNKGNITSSTSFHSLFPYMKEVILYNF